MSNPNLAVAGMAVVSWPAARFLFRKLFAAAFARHARGELDAAGLKGAVRAAYLVKAALLEGPALLGLVTLLLVAMLPCDLSLAPRYCLLNLAPWAIFYLEMAATLPTPGRLDFAVRELGLGENARRPEEGGR